VRVVLVFYPATAFPNRKVKSGVRKIVEKELVKIGAMTLDMIFIMAVEYFTPTAR